MTGYLASFLWRRELKRAQLDVFEQFLKFVCVEDVRENLAPVVGHDHDYCVVAHTDHNYCDRSPWDYNYCVGALTPNNNYEKVPCDHNYSVE